MTVRTGEPIGSDEQPARFIVYDRYVRQDLTVRPEAFIPFPYPDLSVTRHRGLTGGNLWQVGDAVAQAIGRPLHGRADVVAATCSAQRLKVISDPVLGNPNHANVTGWPADKPAQKMIAQEIAAQAHYEPAPK